MTCLLYTSKLTNGKTLEYRIIGINHDDLADGTGKAGLTFLTTSTGISSRVKMCIRDRSSCSGKFESQLHRAVKSLLADSVGREFRLPMVSLARCV